jgi:peptidase YpeB-like protein
LASGAILVHVKRSPKEMTMDRKKLIAGVVAVLALGGGVAIAALSAVPGKAVETEFEREGGAAIYEVEIIGKDGKLHEVAVSAGDGKALGQET